MFHVGGEESKKEKEKSEKKKSKESRRKAKQKSSFMSSQVQEQLFSFSVKVTHLLRSFLLAHDFSIEEKSMEIWDFPTYTLNVRIAG